MNWNKASLRLRPGRCLGIPNSPPERALQRTSALKPVRVAPIRPIFCAQFGAGASLIRPLHMHRGASAVTRSHAPADSGPQGFRRFQLVCVLLKMLSWARAPPAPWHTRDPAVPPRRVPYNRLCANSLRRT